MKNRHFSLALFIVPWLIILAIPTLRLILQVQAQGSDLMTEYGGPATGVWHNAAARAARLHQQIAVRYPEDARAQAHNLEAAYLVADAAPGAGKTVQEQQQANFKRAISDYDALVRRFPGQAWLIANRLRFTTRQPFYDRVDELDPTTTSSNSTLRPQIVFTADDLAQTMTIAKAGQQLEPDNSFYDWIIAQCLFGLRRDEEALAVLHEAALKSHYDAHIQDDVQAEMATRELARPLLSEEKLTVIFNELLPQLSGHRQTARLAVVAGVHAEDAGDHLRALGIYQDVTRLGAVMRDNDCCVIGRLVGIAIQRMAWTGKTRQPTAMEKKRYADQGGALAQLAARKFALYATAHGRADLAIETQSQAQAMARFRQEIAPLVGSDNGTEDILFGISSRTFKFLADLWWISVNLLPQLLLNLILWLGLSLTLRYFTAPRQEKVSWLDVTSLLVISSCATAALIVLALLLSADWDPITGFHPGGEDLVALISKLVLVVPASLGAMLCGGGVLWRQRLNGWGPSLAHGLACYRKMLGAFVTLASIIYLLLLVASLPARHAINAKLDVVIQQGAMALVQQPNSKP